jgi:DNA-binding NarL/FixJ family response regulator
MASGGPRGSAAGVGAQQQRGDDKVALRPRGPARRGALLELHHLALDDPVASGAAAVFVRHGVTVPDGGAAVIAGSHHSGWGLAANAHSRFMRADNALMAADALGRSEIRIVLAEDDVLLREGLASLLERCGFQVVGQCDRPQRLLALVREHRPELAIVDIRMPPTHRLEGLEAARAIRAELPRTAILLLSAHVEVEHAMDLLASGQRSGYLLKSRVSDVDEFVETLERLVRGGSAVDPALVQELVAARHAHDPLDVLSPREKEVLALMAEGRSNAGIAHRLWVSEGTVEKHVRSILSKLQLPESAEDHRRVLAVIAFLEAR